MIKATDSWFREAPILTSRGNRGLLKREIQELGFRCAYQETIHIQMVALRSTVTKLLTLDFFIPMVSDLKNTMNTG